MSQVTPSQVTLLVLIDMYVKNIIPPPHHLATLHFLSLHTAHLDAVALAAPHRLSTTHFRLQMTRVRLLEETVQIVGGIRAFERLLRGRGGWEEGKDLWEVFLEGVWRLDCLEGMARFVVSRVGVLMRKWNDVVGADVNMVYDPEEIGEEEEEKEGKEKDGEEEAHDQKHPRRRLHIDPHSPIGIFLRSTRLALLSHPFPVTAALWESFVAYRQPTISEIRHLRLRWPQSSASYHQNDKNKSKYAFDVVLGDPAEPWSAEERAVLAEVGYQGMVRKGGKDKAVMVGRRELEGVIDCLVGRLQRLHVGVGGDKGELRRQFEDLVGAGVGGGEVLEKLEYLECLEAYFQGDQSVTVEKTYKFFDGIPASGPGPGPGLNVAATGNAGVAGSSKDGNKYHIALMTLALFKADFGCHGEAVTTMLEAISTARENGDDATLNFCLRWLFGFTLEQPGATQAAVGGDSPVMSNMTDTIAYLKEKATQMKCAATVASTYCLEAEQGLRVGDSLAAVWEAVTRAECLAGAYGLGGLLGVLEAVARAAWARMGVAALAGQAAAGFLQTGVVAGSVSDAVAATMQAAAGWADAGHYGKVFALVDRVREQYPMMNAGLVARVGWWRGYFRARQLIAAGELETAGEVLGNLEQNTETATAAGRLLPVQITYLVRRGQLAKALAVIERHTKLLDSGASFYEYENHVRLLVEKAKVLSRCGGGGVRGFSAAMRGAMAAVSGRDGSGVCEAIGVLAGILNRMGEFAGAVQLLRVVVPRAVETGRVEVCGGLWEELGEGYVGLAGRTVGDIRGALVREGVKCFEKAAGCFQRVGDVQRWQGALARRAVGLRVVGGGS